MVMTWGLVCVIVVVLYGSIKHFLDFSERRGQRIIVEHFYSLLLVYVIVMLAFGMIYFIFASQGMPILMDELLQHESILDRLGHSIYFSGVTLLTVGYGDITPIGIGRVIALVEALIGYVLPAAFFVQLMHDK
ncbi:two pore domain potassium channel family protein [Pontibacillus yanchengensis]|uniref:Two pore domain potassium channel family protein n=2 Tax=Pontibacillus yanchengensis TaxID=462910 RepID=A0A6I5A4Q6_9BACI|nr:potassium channel family protein [Pontibacillus yanchengensis]MYL35297.1 two pore domain potassium channel family protein [Pontibacillus yanchengensis]MYL54908.1 two pore domain potassium channel family protein [Pontibacillus yanchengensis]